MNVPSSPTPSGPTGSDDQRIVGTHDGAPSDTDPGDTDPGETDPGETDPGDTESSNDQAGDRQPDSDDTTAGPDPKDQVAVVLMAYGTPTSTDQIAEYYTDIRRGRPPTPEQLDDLVRRYEAIGGLSPLAARTEAQREAIQSALDQIEPGRYRVVLGLKHAAPKIETTVDELAEDGVSQIVGLVLAPHYSEFSVGQYLSRLTEAASAHDIEVVGIESWATEPAFVDFLVEDLNRRLDVMDGTIRVVFTAHSLPERILESGDPYPDQLRATAEAIAEGLGLNEGDDWQVAWQSAGRTPEPWLGPDILESIEEIAAEEPMPDGIIVSAAGFVSDHLEVLYDLDIEARDLAEELGLRFDRTTCVNDDASVMGALAATVDQAASEKLQQR